MFIFELTRTDPLKERWIEQGQGAIVIAETEKAAREMFQNDAFGSFFWPSDSCVKVTLLGAANVNAARVVCRDVVKF